MILLILPIGLINAYINYRGIQKGKVNNTWHVIQLGILVGVLVILILLNVVAWKEVLLIVSLYYTAFEVTLNLLRKLPFNYVGKTSMLDKLLRKVFKNEAIVRQVFTVSKILLVFAGIAIFLT